MKWPRGAGLLIALSVLALLCLTVTWFWLRAGAPYDGARIAQTPSGWRADGVVIAQADQAQGGLMVGERVLGIGGRRLDALAEAGFLSGGGQADLRVNQALVYTVERGGQILDLPVVLRDSPLRDFVVGQWGLLLMLGALVLVGAFVFVRRPDEPAAQALLLLAAGAVGSLPFAFGLGPADLFNAGLFWSYQLLVLISYSLLFCALLHLALVFPQPDSWLSRRRRVVPLIYILPLAIHLVVIGGLSFVVRARLEWFGLWGIGTFVGELVYLPLALAALVLRFLRARDPVSRRQVRWVVWAVALNASAYLLFLVIPQLALGRALFDNNALALTGLLIPFAIAAAILRYRLFDIDLLIRRSLIYGPLTAFVIGAYVLSVGAVGTLVQNNGQLGAVLLTAVLAVVSVRPLYTRVARAANRLVPVQALPAGPALIVDGPRAEDGAPLRGRAVGVARSVWFITALLAAALLLASIPNYVGLVGLVTEQERSTANLLGGPLLFSPSPDFEYVADVAYSALSFSAALLSLVLAGLIFRRGSDRVMPLVVSLTLLLYGILMAGPLEMLIGQKLAAESLALFGQMLLWAFMLFVLYIFPDGRFVPRWTRWASPLLIPWALGLAWWQLVHPLDPSTALPFMALYTLPSLTAPAAQLYRYRRVASLTERQQTKWVIFGFTTWIVAGTGLTAILIFLAMQFFQGGGVPSFWSSFFVFAGRMVWPLSLAVVPICLAVAVLRYRLFEIDVILQRTLVYGTLTAVVIAVYVGVVGALGALFETGGNLVISLIATALVAVLFQPVRARLQRGVNRLVYGERDDPYVALARFGERLEGTLAADAILPAIVETIAQALKLPYAALELKHADGFALAAEHGTNHRLANPAPLERLPLVYQKEVIGELVLAPRAPGESFTNADRRLLADLARQAGIAAHAVRLTNDLQHSRERLVNAREEERLRIRRDLHDGLGPALASLTLKLDAARNLLRTNPAAADQLLLELRAQSQLAIGDIRRLVYDLRPPALDELGLVPALREHVRQLDGLRVRVDAPDELPPLPAAVEVAAYRIVMEAVTNVIRHAGARGCVVTLSLTDVLEVRVEDDGRGWPADTRPGVGLASMRERAAELGGTFSVGPRPGGGACVEARLPLAGPE